MGERELFVWDVEKLFGTAYNAGLFAERRAHEAGEWAPVVPTDPVSVEGRLEHLCARLDDAFWDYEGRCSRWTTPTARKDHWCAWEGCPRPSAVIQEGETYFRQGGWGGIPYHLRCGWALFSARPVPSRVHPNCGKGCITRQARDLSS